MERVEGEPQFCNSIFKVLKTVHPECGISKISMGIVNSLIVDVCRALIAESLHVCEMRKANALTSREMQETVVRVFPGALGEHAVSEGVKACVMCAAAEMEEERGNSMPTSADGPPRSGLVFPVGRVHHLIVACSRVHADVTAAVYLAGVLEYLAAEVLELAGHEALIRGLVSIKPRHIENAIRKDQEISTLLTAARSRERRQEGDDSVMQVEQNLAASQPKIDVSRIPLT